MTSELDARIEMTRMLFTYAQTVRCSKRRPQLAAAAVARELQLGRELEELEREAAKQQELATTHELKEVA